MEGVKAVVLAGFAAGVVDAAPGNDVHVAPLANEEVVVDHLRQAGLADNHGNVYRLADGVGGDADVNARLARFLFGGNLDVGRIAPGVQLSVAADVVGPLGGLFQVRNLLQELPFRLVHTHHSPSCVK